MTGTVGAPRIILTERDYAILQGIGVHRPLAPRGYYTVLNARLRDATIVAAPEPDVVSIGSLVSYRIGAGNLLEHRLVLGTFEPLMGRSVSVRTIVGIVLLGASAGDVVVLPGGDGEQMVINAVEAPPPVVERERIAGLRSLA